jgi:hypothetical protein
MATNILNLGRVVGPGVPKGGKLGEVLVKASSNDYDTKWGEGASPGESISPRVVGESKIFFRELTDLEMANNRLLKPAFQILLIEDYQELFDFFYCGDDQNNTAPWWYRCDDTGSRDVQGEYFRVISPEGLFPRFAGKNKVYGVNGKLVPEGNLNDLNNPPYDGKEIGGFRGFGSIGDPDYARTESGNLPFSFAADRDGFITANTSVQIASNVGPHFITRVNNTPIFANGVVADRYNSVVNLFSVRKGDAVEVSVSNTMNNNIHKLLQFIPSRKADGSIAMNVYISF